MINSYFCFTFTGFYMQDYNASYIICKLQMRLRVSRDQIEHGPLTVDRFVFSCISILLCYVFFFLLTSVSRRWVTGFDLWDLVTWKGCCCCCSCLWRSRRKSRSRSTCMGAWYGDSTRHKDRS